MNWLLFPPRDWTSSRLKEEGLFELTVEGNTAFGAGEGTGGSWSHCMNNQHAESTGSRVGCEAAGLVPVTYFLQQGSAT